MVEFERNAEAEGQRVVETFNTVDARMVQKGAKERVDLTEREGQEAVRLSFEPLSVKNLEEAQALCNVVFALEGETASKDLESSLSRVSNADTTFTEGLYWLAKDSSGRVAGITGVYGLVGDKPQHCWLGWFALKPSLRGHTLGTQMLEFTMKEAEKQEKTNLYIISSDHPDMAGNAKFYHQNDCPIVAVLNSFGSHVGTDGRQLPQSIIRGTREHYRSFIDGGVNIFIRRRKLEKGLQNQG